MNKKSGATRFEYAADEIVRVHYEITSPPHMARKGSIRVVKRNSDVKTKEPVWSYLAQLGFKRDDSDYRATMSIEKRGSDASDSAA